LGDADPIAEGDGCKVVEPRVFCKPAGFSRLQSPGEFHLQAGLDPAARSDAGTKGAHQMNSPGGTWQPAGRQNWGAEAKPERLNQERGARVPIGRCAVAVKLLVHQLSSHLYKARPLAAIEDPAVKLAGLVGYLVPAEVLADEVLASASHGGALGGAEGEELL